MDDIDEENERAKSDFITAFHDYAKERIEFLKKLVSDGRQDEALTLCLSYIDSFSHWLEWPSDKVGRNFVNAVVKFGSDPFMSLAHPLQAIRAFDQMNKPWPEIAKAIQVIYPGPLYQLLHEDEFLSQLSPQLTRENLIKVREELWRTTVAGVAYFGMRNFAIHKFGATPLTFSNTTYQGQPTSGLDFERLYNVVEHLHAELRCRSEANNQWFGNDAITDS